MQKVAFGNRKGGVGKTLVSSNVAEGLARRDNDVFLMDLDHQANSTEHFGLKDEYYSMEKNISKIMTGEIEKEEIKDLVVESDENVKIIPGSSEMDKAVIKLSRDLDQYLNLKRAVEFLDYDYLVIDTGPLTVPTTDAAFMAAGNIISVVRPHKTSINGVSELFDVAKSLNNGFDTNVSVEGIVANQIRRDRVTIENMNDLKKNLDNYLISSIKLMVDLEDAEENGMSLYEFKPDHKMIKKFEKIVDFIEGEDNG